MKNTSSKKSKISTPKKVALAILGALTLLTLVNLIEAGVNKHSHDAAAIYEEFDHDYEHDFEHEQDFEFEINIDEKNFDITVKEGSGFGSNGDEIVLSKDFEVYEGELLSVLVGDADINIETNSSDKVQVVISLDGKDMTRAREYFENQNFEVNYEEGAVYITTNPIKKNYNWDNTGGARVFIDIDIPAVFNADIKTSDGNISLRSPLKGDVSLHTSDGDILTEGLDGATINLRTSDGDISSTAFAAQDISIRTSDGDIKVEDLVAEEIIISTSDGDIRGNSLEGITAVSTSDGDIFLANLRGSEANLRTSDGEIMVEELSSDNSKIQTSDGGIVLSEVRGNLTAKTSSGDLRVSLLDAADVFLRTGDGNIQIEAPKSYAATLYLKGERVRVSPGFTFSGDIKDDVADGQINGGGYTFEARTSDGEVIFREN